MSKIGPPTLDFTKENDILQIFPCLPIFSSQQRNWKGIHFGHHYQPPHETPEYHTKQYIISIHFGKTIFLEKWWGNGDFLKQHITHGDICIYPANISQRERWDGDTEFSEIYLETSLFSRLSEELNGNSLEIVPQVAIRDPLIEQMVIALKTELQSTVDSMGSFGSNFYAESIANTLVIHLLKKYSQLGEKISPNLKKLPRYKLKIAIDYIQENLDQDLSLEKIAKAVDISQYHFSRMFKNSQGVSPYQYVLKCRVERAKDLLLKGDIKTADIAYQVGFANQSHMNRHFKAHVGVTPQKFLQEKARIY